MKIRPATKKDVPEIVRMIANDTLGRLREDYREPLPDIYYKAFGKFQITNSKSKKKKNWNLVPIAIGMDFGI